ELFFASHPQNVRSGDIHHLAWLGRQRAVIARLEIGCFHYLEGRFADRGSGASYEPRPPIKDSAAVALLGFALLGPIPSDAAPDLLQAISQPAHSRPPPGMTMADLPRSL